MTRNELIENMARAIHETMSEQAVIEYLDNPFEASQIAQAALTAIEAAGLAIVPVEATPGLLGAWYRVKNGFHYHDEPEPTDKSDYTAYRAMIYVGKL